VLIALAGIPVSARQSAAVAPDAVQRAETRGAAYQRGEKRFEQVGVDAQAHVGTKDRKCVEVGDADVVQSGDFVAGSFKFFSGHWQSSGARKLWWMPRYLPNDQAPGPLLLEATALDRLENVNTYRGESIVRGAAGFYFFNTDFGLPQAGRWLIVGTAGPNWGCFIVAVKDTSGSLLR
jgi:hypothetical protein